MINLRLSDNSRPCRQSAPSDVHKERLILFWYNADAHLQNARNFIHLVDKICKTLHHVLDETMDPITIHANYETLYSVV